MKMNEASLPKEWIELVKIAMNSNMSKDHFRIFLKKEEEKRTNN